MDSVCHVIHSLWSLPGTVYHAPIFSRTKTKTLLGLFLLKLFLMQPSVLLVTSNMKKHWRSETHLFSLSYKNFKAFLGLSVPTPHDTLLSS